MPSLIAKERVVNDHEIALLTETGASLPVVNALILYIEERRPVGHFLTSVLENNLNGSFAYADETNVKAIGALIRWIYNYAPGTCWGSREKVQRWLAERTEQRLEEEASSPDENA